MSTYYGSPVTSPTTGAAVWSRVPDAAHPGTFLPSYSKGGFVWSIQAHGGGKETATWTVTGLTQGYYKIEFFYQANASNATYATVVYRTTATSSFVALPTKLDETRGTPVVAGAKPVNGWLPVYANVTPYQISNAKSYVWVPTGSALAVQLSDAGCSSGRIIADTIRLTFISGTK